MTLEEFFANHDDSRRLFDAVRETIESIGPAQVRVSKSQVAFRRKRGFAYVWMPAQYLGERGAGEPGADGRGAGGSGTGDRLAPLVLTIGLRRRDTSARWKQVVEPAPGRFTRHLELRSADEIDEQVVAWLKEAWEVAE